MTNGCRCRPHGDCTDAAFDGNRAKPVTSAPNPLSGGRPIRRRLPRAGDRIDRANQEARLQVGFEPSEGAVGRHRLSLLAGTADTTVPPAMYCSVDMENGAPAFIKRPR